MALEIANTINQLVESNPLGTDNKSQGDDHIRLIKKTLRNTFPNITGPITVSEAAINGLGTGKNLTFPGMIVMWSGATVPSGWLLCDGTGTLSNGQAVPDLRGKFIVGAGSGAFIGDTGGSASVSINGSTTESAQSFSIPTTGYSITGRTPGTITGGSLVGGSGRTEINETLESLSETVAGPSVGLKHSHTFSVTAPNLPPYYALAFIIKE